MDPVEKLFQALPTPKSHHALSRHGIPIGLSKSNFASKLAEFLSTPSTDPDFDYEYLQARGKETVAIADETISFNHFHQSILQLGVHTEHIPHDDSARSQQLRYYRWVGYGRKDSDSPFPSDCPHLSFPISTGDWPSLAYLPDGVVNKQTCVTCGKSQGFTCSGCLLKLDEHHVIFRTMYCSEQCQRADWPQHKTICSSRKKIGRAAVLLRDLFILFQSLNWINGDIRIIEYDGILKNHEDLPYEKVFKGTQAVAPFARAAATSEDDFRASLTSQKSGIVMRAFRPIVGFLLDSIVSRIDKVWIYPRNVHRPTTIVNDSFHNDNMMTPHMLLRAKTCSGEDVAIDIASAEFGWREPLSLWQDWESHRIHGQIDGTQENYRPIMNSINPFQHCQALAMLGAITDTIQRRFPDTDGSASQFLGSPGYDDARHEIMTTARHILEAGLVQLEATKMLRWYFKAGWEVGVTESWEQSELVLEKVWISDEEFQENVHDPKLLQDLWNRRCQTAEVKDSARQLGMSLNSLDD